MGDASEPVCKDDVLDIFPRASLRSTGHECMPFLPFDMVRHVDAEDGAKTTALIIMSWLLVLYRYSSTSDTQLSWTLRDVATTIPLSDSWMSSSTTELPIDKHDLMSSLFNPLKDRIPSGLDSDGRKILCLRNTPPPQDPTPGKKSKAEMQWTLQFEVTVHDGFFWVRPSWLSHDFTSYLALKYVRAFIDIIRRSSRSLAIRIEEVLAPDKQDMSEIWSLNSPIPPRIEVCMHRLIQQRARDHPQSLAIDAWNGTLTYAEVDSYSTSLAFELIENGAHSNAIIPICFEKSCWTAVAVLAVMKAGAAFVLMDPDQPVARLRSIAEMVGAKEIVTSLAQAPLGRSISPTATIISVPRRSIQSEDLNQLDTSELPNVSPSAILYIIFTSGSTGKPKGVVISHSCYSSGAFPRSEGVGYDDQSRVLDFASYAFDVSIDSMLCTLMRGGCLCIPSNEDRVNDLSASIRRMKVTMANMTPSVARILEPDIIPSLRSLGLGGEAVAASDVAKWGAHTRIVIGYGPSECTVGCTINSSAADGKHYTNIGKGTGGVMWIVDPEDHHRLMPIGAVGELLVEGPVVGQGYLNDPERTSAVFIESPTWLTRGFGSFEGRQGRLYKTGDLVKYDPEGSGNLVFVGRKDSQVKVRGQRVELGEIEHHIRSILPEGTAIAAEVIKPSGAHSESTLVAFVAEHDEAAAEPSLQVQVTNFSTKTKELLNTVERHLSQTLPVYMVPTTFIPVNYIPVLISAKTDRKRLRELGSALDLRTLSKKTEASFNRSETPTEVVMRRIWGMTLGLPMEKISHTDHFFQLGGDSISAMRLVANLRESGFSFTVSQAFAHPILGDMACNVRALDTKEEAEIEPFSLMRMPVDKAAIQTEAAEMCEIDPAYVEDVYPCTPMQEVLMALSAKDSQVYVAQRVTKLWPGVDIERFKSAWEATATESAILRTRIVQIHDHGLVQVVVHQNIDWRESHELQTYAEIDKSDKMALGSALARYAIVSDRETNTAYFVWTVHHALYDGWSTPLLLERFKNRYRGLTTSRPPQMKVFVKYLTDFLRESSKDYWRRELHGATGPQFPSLPSRSYLSRPDAQVEHFVTIKKSPTSNATIATYIRGAWALVASRYTGSPDVIFGETMTGRSIPIPGPEQLEGPLIATIPVRVRLDLGSTVHQYLEAITSQASARMLHEHTGLQHIRRVSQDAQIACEVKMGLVIQPSHHKDDNDGDELSDFMVASDTEAAGEAINFNTYPLMLVCSLKPDGFLVMASFDSNIIHPNEMRRVLEHFDSAIQTLVLHDDMLLRDISCLSEDDYAQIWDKNSLPPISAIDGVLQFSRSEENPLSGDRYHKPLVPWIVSPMNNKMLAPVGTLGELMLEGPLDSPAFIHDPPWLVAGYGAIKGRSGKVFSTGEIVKYDADGSIVYICRKMDIEHGKLRANLGQIAHHLLNLFPEIQQVVVDNINFGHEKSQNEEEDSCSTLVAFFPLVQETDNGVALPNESVIGDPYCEPFNRLSPRLCEPLAGIQKAATEVLSPSMIPEVFIPIPTKGVEADSSFRSKVKVFTDGISAVELSKMKIAFHSFIKRHQREANNSLSQGEKMLRQYWSDILKIDPIEIQRNDSFFRLGGDSIQSMKLVSALRLAGYKLSVADIFHSTKLCDMASSMQVVVDPEESSGPPPFSTLNVPDLTAFLGHKVRPALFDPTWDIEDVMPMTERQSYDVMRTINTPKSSVQYNFLYLEHSIDKDKLLQCCQRIIDYHGILRTVFVEHENDFLQVVLKQIEANIEEHETNDDLEAWIEQYCAADIERPFLLGTSFVKLIFVKGDRENCLALRISHAQYDGVSLAEIVREIVSVYDGHMIPRTPKFSSYIYHTLSDKKERSLDYWRQLLAGSTLSVLVPPSNAAKSSTSTFITQMADVGDRPKEVTMATLLTVAWGMLLARHLSVRDVTFGSVVTGRNIELPDVERIVGPCYQYMPVRIRFDRGINTLQLLDSVQRQIVESSQHAIAGLPEISQRCTDWPTGTRFFDSLVHHQDIDYFDTLPIGTGSCRVGFSNPHAEPPQEWKVVSLPRDGGICLGIEASEAWLEFTRLMLSQLAQLLGSLCLQPTADVESLITMGG